MAFVFLRSCIQDADGTRAVDMLEALLLRIKDLELEPGEITIRSGKGNKDRVIMLPDALRPLVAAQIRTVRRLHEADLQKDAGWVVLPGAIDRKLPNAGRELPWQYLSGDPRLARCSHWTHLPSPPARIRGSACGYTRRPRFRHHQARDLPHLPPFLRDAPPARWL
jgi:hypothetical protein